MAIKTILVPTDFTKSALNALNYAVNIASELNSKIILLHTFNTIVSSPEMPFDDVKQFSMAAKKTADKQLDKLIEKIHKVSDVQLEYISIDSLLVDGILETIKNKKIDLVVMGTKGASGFKELFFGTVTSKIIEYAKCPVWAIPQRASYNGLQNITYATDYNVSDITILKKLAEIAKEFKSKINILHIALSNKNIELEAAVLKKFILKVKDKINYKHIASHLLYADDKENGLENYLKKAQTNLITISTQYRTVTEKMFSKSIAKKLSYHSKVPLLTYHHKKTSLLFL